METHADPMPEDTREDWDQWFERCAVENCDPDARMALSARFIKTFQRMYGNRAAYAPISDGDALQQMEAEVYLKNVKNPPEASLYPGMPAVKADFLEAARREPSKACIQVYRARLMALARSAVYHRERGEGHPMAGPTRPAGADETFPSPFESDTYCQDFPAHWHDPLAIEAADRFAAEIFPRLDGRAKLAWLFRRGLGLLLTDTSALASADMKRASVSEWATRASREAEEHLRKLAPHESNDGFALLLILIEERFDRLSVQWAENETASESPAARLLAVWRARNQGPAHSGGRS